MVDAARRRTRHHDANIYSGVPQAFKDGHELLQLAHGCCMSPHTRTLLDADGITERAFRGRSTTELGMEEPCYRQQPLQDVHAQRVQHIGYVDGKPHRPLNTACRFSRNAWVPSLKSCVPQVRPKIDASTNCPSSKDVSAAACVASRQA